MRDGILARHPEYRVFVDVHEIPLGADFPDEVESRLEACDLMLALIGPSWASATDTEGRRRLRDPADFVRLELEVALERGVHLIPVLIHDAKMPTRTEVPDSLTPLLRREAVRLFRDYWTHGFDRLAARLEELASSMAQERDYPEEAESHEVEEDARTPARPSLGDPDVESPTQSPSLKPARGESEGAHDSGLPGPATVEDLASRDDGDPPELELALRVDSTGGSLEISVRELLDVFGHRKRLTDAALDELEYRLESAGLHSRPPVDRFDLNGCVRLLRSRSITEFELRAEVDKSGSVTISIQALMRRFGRRRMTEKARAEVTDALSYCGVVCSPALELVTKEDVVTLSRRGSGHRPPA